MTTRQITAANADEKIKQLYETAFPEDEQIPWNDLIRLVGEMPLDFTAYYDGEDFIGFTIIYPRKSFNWFWYFAVCEELRPPADPDRGQPDHRNPGGRKHHRPAVHL